MYRVILPRRVERQLDSLPPEAHAAVMQGLLGLTNDPQPTGARKLFGYERTWCAYLRDRYRVYYDVDADRHAVLVLAIARSRLARSPWQAEADE